MIKQHRSMLREAQNQLRNVFLAAPNNAKTLKLHCKLIDQLLKTLWLEFDFNQQAALIAAGGYGRGVLFPYSDIDLLILVPEEVDVALNQKIETFIGALWDIGLAVGHSVRNIDECLSEAGKDATVQTNLLESRYLSGDKKAFSDYIKNIRANLNIPNFINAKMLEQQYRHARFNDTAYNLEPNIKESPGGLRDLQSMIWMANALNIGNNWSDLVRDEVISKQEANQIRKHEKHLQILRIHLHYLAQRREDRLIFDFQNELASILGYVTNKKRRASEQLMAAFYKSAKQISLMNEIVLQQLRQKTEASPKITRSINAHFKSVDGYLDIKSSSIFQENHAAIFECFLVLAKQTELRGLSAHLLRSLYRVKTLVNNEFRNNSVNKQCFIEILKQYAGITHALRSMNRYGILGQYIPAFGRIIGQMQHDLFHVYTVDEHILNVVSNLRKFALPQNAHEFPFCSKLFTEFDAPYLLYLAALFHDIAKGRGGDHSTLGAVDAKKFCQSHDLSKTDSALVAWLVDAHLAMSSTAQKSDLSDPEVIRKFVNFVGSERRLIALYLLTVADIRGTSPKVWNAWKAKLLENLFLAARKIIKGSENNIPQNNIEAEKARRQHESTESLNHYAISKKSYEKLWEILGDSYFIKHESLEIAWHTRLLIPHISTEKPIVRARLSPQGDGIQVMIYNKDREDIFAHICGFFERMDYTIAQAKIYTTLNDYALNTFIILDQSDRNVIYRDLLSYIEHELTRKLASYAIPDMPLAGRVSRQVKHMPISTQIEIRHEEKSNYHQIDIIANDKPGLLSKLAHVLLQDSVALHNAKINTLGNRVEDSFLVSAKNKHLLSAQAISKLKQKILEIL